jgi:hypothetical protein
MTAVVAVVSFYHSSRSMSRSHNFENIVDQLPQVVNGGSIVSKLGREAELKWSIMSRLTAIPAGGTPRIGLPSLSDDNNRVLRAG